MAITTANLSAMSADTDTTLGVTGTKLVNMYVTNIHSGAVTFSIKLDTTKYLVKDISLPTGTTLQIVEGDGLYTTCANIRARCDTLNGISVYFTYL